MEKNDPSFSFKPKRLVIIFSFILVALISGGYIYEKGFSYEVNFNNKIIGYTLSENEANNSLIKVNDIVLEKHGENAHFKQEMTLSRVRKVNDLRIDSETLAEEMLESIEVFKPATTIFIDNKAVISVENSEVANTLFENYQKPFFDSKDKVLSVNLENEIKIVDEDVLVSNIVNKELATILFSYDTKEKKVDNAYHIQQVSALKNNYIEIDNSKTDKYVKIKNINLDVKVVKEVIEEEVLEFKIVETKDPNMYIGQKKVSQKGVVGKQEVTYNITYLNNKEVSVDLIDKKVIEKPKDQVVAYGSKPLPKVSYDGNLGSSIVALAKAQIGKPYVFGATSPHVGFDCSGLAVYIYGQHGIYLPHNSKMQSTVGPRIALSDIQPGDLIFYQGQYTSDVGHTAIYIGNGTFIHAPVPGQNVQYGSMSSPYFVQRFVAVTRPR